MSNLELSIPCPTCATKIAFDTMQLLLGIQFKCSNCQSAIGLATESKNLVQDTMNKFEAIKEKI